MRKPMGLRISISEGLLLRGCALCGLDARKDGVVGARAREHDGETDRGDHEDDGCPGGHLGEEVGRAAGTEGRLRALSAEGSGEVGGFTLLEENDSDDEERNDDVENHEKNQHCGGCDLLSPEENVRAEIMGLRGGDESLASR